MKFVNWKISLTSQFYIQKSYFLYFKNLEIFYEGFSKCFSKAQECRHEGFDSYIKIDAFVKT